MQPTQNFVINATHSPSEGGSTPHPFVSEKRLVKQDHLPNSNRLQHIISHTHTLPPYPTTPFIALSPYAHLLLLARAAGSISTLDNSTAKVLEYQLDSSKA